MQVDASPTNQEHHTSRGKWSERGIPHKGWSCVGTDDLGAPDETCEMCETANIRYVHQMQHPEYSEILSVGCVCAERMEEDYVNPAKREKRLRALARRRPAWARRAWQHSQRGNLYLNVDGYNLTLFESARDGSAHWTVQVVNRATGEKQVGRKRHASLDAARRAALDALIWAKEKLPGSEKAD